MAARRLGDTNLRKENLSKQRMCKISHLPQLLALSGFAVLVISLLVVKSYQDDTQAASFTSDPKQLAEVQLDQALEAHLPVLAFFHSDNCEKCLIMMDTVAQVYPEFQEKVILLDVDVYNDLNQPLLRRVRLQYIPTLIFYDRSNAFEVNVGVMEADQLRARLSAISATN
jgi:thiol-disulfide isomerase/thioredoxin